MSRDRETILGSIRAAIAQSAGDEEGRRAAIAARLRSPPRHRLPTRAIPPANALVAQFISYLKAQATGVVEAGSAAEIPTAAAKVLAKAGLPLRLRMGADPRLSTLGWEAASVTRVQGVADPSDGVTLSHAIAGVAETGTLVLASGPDNPTSLAFLPEMHLVAVAREVIVGSYEEVFGMVRAQLGRGAMPRALNLISGASRTGDIGGRIVMGAHGPRALIVILYDREAGAG